MTLPFSERKNSLNAGKCFFDVFRANIRVLSKVWAIIGWTAIILAPSPVESFEFFAFKEKPEFVHRDLVLFESPLQNVTRLKSSQFFRMAQLGNFWTKGFPQLYASEPLGVVVSEGDGKSVGEPSTDENTKKSACDCDQRTVHRNPLRQLAGGLIGIAIGLAIGAPMVWLLCKYVWFT